MLSLKMEDQVAKLIAILAAVVAFGLAAVFALRAGANKTHVAQARERPRVPGEFPLIGPREDYTDLGWRYVRLMIVAALVAVVAMFLASIL